MPQWSLFYHIIWTTKHREAMILPQFQDRLYASIAKKSSTIGGIVHAVRGVADHVHLAVSVPPRIALAIFVGQVKGASAHFVNHVICPGFHFAWQDGYGVISLHESQLHTVVQYILCQAQHHGEYSTVEWLEHCVEDD
ncbi:MAG: IS200/IS605 family transposase [Anaerolineae bacterium]